MVDNSVLTWQIEPKEELIAVTKVYIWETVCGRYQICRFDSVGKECIEFGAQIRTLNGWDIFEHDSKLGVGYPKYYKSLESAILSVEKYHIEKTKVEKITSNKEEVIKYATSKELDISIVKPKKQPKPKVEEPEQVIPEVRELPKEKIIPKPLVKKRLNLLEAVEKVLEDEGKPLTAQEITDLMIKKDYWQSTGSTPVSTVKASICVHIATNRSTSKFIKIDKDTFDLRK